MSLPSSCGSVVTQHKVLPGEAWRGAGGRMRAKGEGGGWSLWQGSPHHCSPLQILHTPGFISIAWVTGKQQRGESHLMCSCSFGREPNYNTNHKLWASLCVLSTQVYNLKLILKRYDLNAEGLCIVTCQVSEMAFHSCYGVITWLNAWPQGCLQCSCCLFSLWPWAIIYICDVTTLRSYRKTIEILPYLTGKRKNTI